ncbi:MAG TPA: hypothetical protein VHN20_15410 [Beijerinckiaceae bacterium]|nr:hypothetical protein [Beijerinckiaceae bacterium]
MPSGLYNASRDVIPTLHHLAGQHISNDEMLERLKEEHPDATLPEIVNRAFYAVTDPDQPAGERINRIYDFALAARRLL